MIDDEVKGDNNDELVVDDVDEKLDEISIEINAKMTLY